MWDVKVHEDPILLGHQSGEMKVHVIGTMKLEYQDKEGVRVVLNLYNTLFNPLAKVNLFSPQKMRMVDYLVEQKQKIGKDWIQNKSG